ncbi:YlxR family protein [Anaerolineales bacterium HSG6]|nr:YlxR family protein [Anaerolineales bacterium HSG6]
MAKHQPQRICIACRQKIDKRLLLRIVRNADGQFIVDRTGKVNGRGAYFCQQPACWQKAIQAPSLSRALKTAVSANDIVAIKIQLGQNR